MTFPSFPVDAPQQPARPFNWKKHISDTDMLRFNETMQHATRSFSPSKKLMTDGKEYVAFIDVI
jgi:hypothetical protein